MATPKARQERRIERQLAEKRFEKQRRQNLLKAQSGTLPFIVVLDNLKPSYNIGKIFRSADAFGARELHLIGIDSFDPSSAKGSFKWVPAIFHKTFAACYASLAGQGYTLFLLEPGEGRAVHQSVFPEKSAFIMGPEKLGFSFDKKDFDGVQSLRIEQSGRVQSLNVSVAASVVMYEYFRQYNKS